MPLILPLFAPTINSYKRSVEGAWAPTTLTWAIDNRTTALRVLPSVSHLHPLGNQGGRLRFQPLSGDGRLFGLWFVWNQKQTEIENARHHWEWLCRSEKWGCREIYGLAHRGDEKIGALLRNCLERNLFEHSVSTREWEWRQFSKAVTDWELQRYLEII